MSVNISVITNLFPSTYAAYIFSIVILIWLLSELIGGRIIPSLKRGGSTVQKKTSARGLNAISVIAWIAVFTASTNFAKNDIAMLPSWVYYVGIAFMLAGIAFRQWAIAVLGRYFSGVIGVQKEQKVVQTGPYRLIRHPSYTGHLLMMVGIGLAVQSWGAVLAVLLIFGLAYGHRMLVEEKVLISEIGNSYVEYMKRTKRVIPFLI
jgi:protein-S-isoprenylcysteine O-methyltransferase Ste14